MKKLILLILPCFALSYAEPFYVKELNENLMFINGAATSAQLATKADTTYVDSSVNAEAVIRADQDDELRNIIASGQALSYEFYLATNTYTAGGFSYTPTNNQRLFCGTQTTNVTSFTYTYAATNTYGFVAFCTNNVFYTNPAGTAYFYDYASETGSGDISEKVELYAFVKGSTNAVEIGDVAIPLQVTAGSTPVMRIFNIPYTAYSNTNGYYLGIKKKCTAKGSGSTVTQWAGNGYNTHLDMALPSSILTDFFVAKTQIAQTLTGNSTSEVPSVAAVNDAFEELVSLEPSTTFAYATNGVTTNATADAWYFLRGAFTNTFVTNISVSASGITLLQDDKIYIDFKTCGQVNKTCRFAAGIAVNAQFDADGKMTNGVIAAGGFDNAQADIGSAASGFVGLSARSMGYAQSGTTYSLVILSDENATVYENYSASAGIFSIAEPGITRLPIAQSLDSDSSNAVPSVVAVNDALALRAIRSTNSQPNIIASFISDDGYANDRLEFGPIFIGNGVPLNIALITSNAPVFGGWIPELCIEYQNTYGWNFASHSVTHPELTNLTLVDLDYELSQSKADIIAAGVRCDYMVYPFGLQNKLVRDETRKYYKLGFATGRDNTRLGINEMPIYSYNLSRQSADLLPLTNLIVNVDTAISNGVNAWLVYVIHGSYGTDTNIINSLILYLKTNNIPIVNLDAGYSMFGNIIDIGDREESNTLPSSDSPHSIVAPNGSSIFSDSSRFFVENAEGRTASNLPSAFKPRSVTSVALGVVASGGTFPTTAGTLTEVNSGADIKFSHQYWRAYTGGGFYSRDYSGGGWSPWIEHITSSNTTITSSRTPSLSSTNNISAFCPDGRLAYLSLSSAQATTYGFPSGGILITDRVIQNAAGYTFQLFHSYESPTIKKRVWKANSTWGEWFTLGGGLTTTNSFVATGVTNTMIFINGQLTGWTQ